MTSAPVTFMLTPRGPFSLAASIRFLAGFTPARYAGSAEPVLRLAFPLDGRWTPVGLRVRQDADGWCTDGRLDAARLRALPTSEALRELSTLAGIGPFSAELILLRGAGAPDVALRHEPRLRHAVRDAYRPDGDVDVDVDTLTRITDGWRPYRTWVSLLLRTWREDESGETSGRRRR